MSEEELKQDTFLKGFLQSQLTPEPASDFTDRVMARVEAAAASKARIYEPLIAAAVWRKIAIGFGVLLAVQLLICVWIMTQWQEVSLSAKMLGKSFIDSLQISRNLAYQPQLISILVICTGYFILDKLRGYFTSGNREF